jgi:hypothetical protein
VPAATPETELLAQIESGQATRQMLDFAARGLLPLPPGELVRAVTTVIGSQDAELVKLAKETFTGFSPENLKEAVFSAGVRPEQLDTIARHTAEASVLEPLIRHKAVTDGTLAWLAERVDPPLQDILITNQARLLQAPVIVERLFENPHLSAEIRRRADEFLEEFFLKKERELDAARESAEARAARPQPESTKAEAPVEKPKEEEEEKERELSEEEKKSLFLRLSTMTVAQKIQLAWRGTQEERMFLVRDPNRLVSGAVLKSPKTREADAETIANMKSVSEEVLRGLALHKEWLKRYSVLSALVKNPRSPIDVTLPLVMRLSSKDKRILAGDRNVPEAIRAYARREVSRRDL